MSEEKERMVYRTEMKNSPTTKKETMNNKDYFLPRMVICENEKESEHDDDCSGSETESSTKIDEVDVDEEDEHEEEACKDRVQDEAHASHSNQPDGADANAHPLVENLAELHLHDHVGAQGAGDNGPPGVATPEKSTATEAAGLPFSTTVGHPALVSPNNMEDVKQPAAAAMMQAQAYGTAPPSSMAIPTDDPDPTVVIEIEERDELSSLYVGRIIGKGGEMIRDLQARSGCRIDVHQDVEEGAPRIITYRGRRREDIDLAKQLVHMLCTSDIQSTAQSGTVSKDTEQGETQQQRRQHVELPLGRAILKRIQVPKSSIGKIIGRGGEMIRELQGRSGARIQIDHEGEHAKADDTVSDEQQDQYHEDSNHYHGSRHQHPVQQVAVAITGTEESVALAEDMIMFLARNPGVDGHLIVKQHRSDWGSHMGNIHVGGHHGHHGHRHHGHQHQHGHMVHPQLQMQTGHPPYWTGPVFGQGDMAAQHPAQHPLPPQVIMQASSSHSFLGLSSHDSFGVDEGSLYLRQHSSNGLDFATQQKPSPIPTTTTILDHNLQQQQGQLLHPSSPWMNIPPAIPSSSTVPGTTVTSSMMIESDVIPCLKSDIGHIIGKKGVTINDLQQRSSTNIQIDQRCCQITITGPRQGIEMAKDMLREIFERGMNHSFAGGRGGVGGGSVVGGGFELHLHPQYPGIVHAASGGDAGTVASLGQYARVGLEPPGSTSSELLDDHLIYAAATPPAADGAVAPELQHHLPYQYHHQTSPLQQQQQLYYEGDPQQQQQQQQHTPAMIQASTPQASSSTYPWQRATTIDGKVYYFNQETMESTWETPPDVVFD